MGAFFELRIVACDLSKRIFDNLWKFTGISVKYKTQIGTNGHKLSKILLLIPVG